MKRLAKILLIYLCLALTVNAQIGGPARISGAGRVTRALDPAGLSAMQTWFETRRLSTCVPAAALSTFPDATSHANDATSSLTLRMTTQSVGGRCALLADGVNDTMTIPAGVSQNIQETTVFLVIYPSTLYNIQAPFGLGTNQVTLLSYNGQYTYATEGSNTQPPTPAQEVLPSNYVGPSVIWPSVIMVQYGAAGTLMRVNGVDATGPARVDGVLTGGKFGQFSNDSSYWQGYFFLAPSIAKNISNTDRDAVYSSLMSEYRGAYSTTQNLIVTIGSSNTLGIFASTPTNAYPAHLIDLLQTDGKNYQLFNDAHTGMAFGDMQSLLAADITPKYSASRSKNIAIIAVAAYVDLVGGATGANTYTALTSIVSTLKATGWTVIVTTQTPSAEPTWVAAGRETQRVNFNNLVRTNSISADCVVNTDAVVNLSNPSNATYFYFNGSEFDGHLADAGLLLLGQTIHDTCTF